MTDQHPGEDTLESVVKNVPSDIHESDDSHKPIETLRRVAIRFAGDSGDGMQLVGSQFSTATAFAGNDLATFPNYPAEIRAPAGTVAGVSGFQLNFASLDVHTPGDQPDVLVAMNPAAMKANIKELKLRNGILVVNKDTFTPANLKKAGYTEDPMPVMKENYQVFEIPLTTATRKALEDTDLSQKEVDRCKNFFALGLMYWLFHRPLQPTIDWIEHKFKDSPAMIEANIKVLKAGYFFGETTEIFQVSYKVRRAPIKAGLYRNVTGNIATGMGLLTASKLSGLSLFYGSYPITPASDILHQLASYSNYGVTTFQAEDEIAAVCAAIGASFAGNLGVTGTSGPGVALKTEAIGLAVMTELPLLIVNVQRGGPSTGLPTKTEQADLWQALYGRSGESPLVVLAAQSPVDCFFTAIEAARIALKYMTPVIMLSDGYLANGAEPWRLPQVNNLEPFPVHFRQENNGFLPYFRDEKTLARPWAVPGTPGLEHVIGGLESAENTGNVNYEPENHERMVLLRAEKVARVAQDIAPLEIHGDESADMLVVGWGSTYGAIWEAVEEANDAGMPVAGIHLRHLNPFPSNLEEILRKFETILVVEMNTGQLAHVLQGTFAIKVERLNKIQGVPIHVHEIVARIEHIQKRAA